MNTFAEIVKTLFLILVVAQVMYFLLKRTFAGKCIVMCFKIIGEMFKLAYLTLEHVYKFLYRKSAKLKSTKGKKQLSKLKKTATGETVVDFNSVKAKKSKPEPTA